MANRLAGGPYRLLLISNDVANLTRISEGILSGRSDAEIDVIECVKDGCWEADVIILAVNNSEERFVAQLMKEVATQKIVVNISNDTDSEEGLQQFLPYSKVVNVVLDPGSDNAAVTGDDDEANDEVTEIFQSAGYSVKQLNHFLKS